MPIRLASLKSGLAAGALVAALCGMANAQTLLPELLVISPSLVPIEASKSGSSVTVMTGEEARSSGFTQLSDVMRTFPGIAVSQSGSRGSLTQFRVRGAEANHLLVMIDGVPANSVSDGEYNFADIPLEDIERIELLRGPQSGLYGANAHSGVLTIETKSGRGLAKPEFTARLEGGTQRSAEGCGDLPRRARAVLRLDHGELRDHQRLQHRARRKRNRRRQARLRDQQGRRRSDALLQRRRLRPPPLPQRPDRSAGSVLPQQRSRRRCSGLQHQDRGDARARPGHAEAVRRSLDPVREVDRIAHRRHGDRELRADLGLARHRADAHLQEQRVARQRYRRRRETSHHWPGREPARVFSNSTASSCSGPISMPRTTAMCASPTASAANTCSTCCGPAPRYRSRSGRTSTSRSRTNTPGAIRSRRSSA